jgi:glycosyltransferase involved in cell wall biosynthesis
VHGPYPVGEPRVARQAQAALRAGYEVDVIAMRQTNEPALEDVEGVRVLRLPIAHRRGASAARVFVEYLGFTALASFTAAALSARRRYAVVQVNNPPDFLIAVALVPKLLGARVAFDVHDLSPDMFGMRFGSARGARAAAAVLLRLERLATRLADVVVTVHEPYRRELEARGVPSGKITVVMNTLDERLLPAPVQRPRDAGFRVAYHGTVTPHYGVQILLEAVALIAGDIADLRLQIYGEGDAVPALRRRAAELGIGDRMEITDRYLPQREVLRRIRGASVGVVPNLPNPLNRYALSSKLFEYVALGIPVVSADLPTLRAHFSDDEVRFFTAGDARSLAAALLAVHGDPAAAAARVDAARRRYEAYRWSENERRYLAALEGAA